MPFWETCKNFCVNQCSALIKKIKPRALKLKEQIEKSKTFQLTYKAAAKIYKSPFLRKKLSQIRDEGGRGLKATLRWTGLLKLLQSPKAQKLKKLLADSFRINIVYNAIPVLIYMGWYKPIMQKVAPAFETSAPGALIDLIANYFFLSFCAATFLKNLYYSMSIGNEMENLTEPTVHLKTCGDSKVEIEKANLESSFIFYPRNLLTATVASWVPYTRGWLGTVILAMVYGQNLLEYRFASVGTCTKHRAKLLAENNPYAFAHGLSLMLASACFRDFLCALTPFGMQSAYIDNAVLSFMLQIYMVFSLMNDEPLPGHEEGEDWFEFNRSEMLVRAERAVSAIAPQLEAKPVRPPWMQRIRNIFYAEKKAEEKEGESQIKLIDAVKGVCEYPPLQLSVYILLAPGLFGLKAFYDNPRAMFSEKILTPEVYLKIPELAALVKAKKDNIYSFVSLTKWARATSFIVAYIPGWIVSANVTNAFQFVGKLDPALVSQVAVLPDVARRLEEPTQEESVGIVPMVQVQLDVDKKALVNVKLTVSGLLTEAIKEEKETPVVQPMEERDDDFCLVDLPKYTGAGEDDFLSALESIDVKKPRAQSCGFFAKTVAAPSSLPRNASDSNLLANSFFAPKQVAAFPAKKAEAKMALQPQGQ